MNRTITRTYIALVNVVDSSFLDDVASNPNSIWQTSDVSQVILASLWRHTRLYG